MAEDILKSGTHIARIAAIEEPDGTFAAQVYVRLEREPEIAETYIPAGIHASEGEALAAARQRATEALVENQF